MMRRFTLEDQRAFAALSGDFNPLHVDPLAARRTMYGVPVVHGVHLLLWAFAETLARGTALQSLKVTFLSPARIDTPVSIHAEKDGRITLKAAGERAARIAYTTGPVADFCVPGDRPDRTPCRERSDEAIEGAAGELPLALPGPELASVLPGLQGKLPDWQIAALLATTRLVGMECPGLHSIFGELGLDFNAPDAGAKPALSWKVASYDPRFSLTRIETSAPGMAGTLTAFSRPRPVEQPSFAALRGRVDRPDFADERSLVVGGSRGLGELTAKMLAAAGADVLLTYRSGRADAERVRDEIVSGGGKADVMALDVNDPPPQLPGGFRPTQLFYFATPPISASPTGRFRYDVFERFNDCYVRAFYDLIVRCAPEAGRKLSVMYPSSVFVTDTPPNMGEYAASKAAGESLCAFLQSAIKGLHIHVERLPRLPTDQTASLIPARLDDPVDVMANVLKAMARF